MHDDMTAGLGENDIIDAFVLLRPESKIITEGAGDTLHILEADVFLGQKHLGQLI